MYNIGSSAEDITMNLLGFAVQQQLFDKIHDGIFGSDYLGMLTLTAGLIGFLVFFLMPRAITLPIVSCWLILAVILIVRPVGDTLFFSEIAPETLKKPVPVGGMLTQSEHEAAIGGAGGQLTYNDVLQSHGVTSGKNKTIYGFTPQLLALQVMNDMAVNLATDLLPLGMRTLDNYNGAIEAVRRNQFGDKEANYLLSNYITLCGNKDPRFMDKAAIASEVMEKQYPREWQAMKDTKMSAYDAVLGFQKYKDYMSSYSDPKTQPLYPALICASCSETSLGSLADKLKPIIATSGEDFVRVRDNLGNTFQDLKVGLGKDEISKLKDTPVALVVPTNLNAVTDVKFKSASNTTSKGVDIGSTAVRMGTATAGGLAAGAAGCALSASIGAGMTATVVGAPLGLVTAVGGCLGSILIGGVMGSIAGSGTDFHWTVNAGDVANGKDVGTIIANCQQMHMLNDTRMLFANEQALEMTNKLADFIRDNKGKLEDGMAMLSEQDKAQLMMHKVEEVAVAACKTEDSSKCTDAKKLLYQFQRYAQTAAVNNALPYARAMAEATSKPEFGGTIPNAISAVSGFLTPGLVAIKGTFIGFAAGSYAKIMPVLIAFATGLVIMITPILYIMGLLVPMWAPSVFIIPIISVVYFQAVKVVFVLISIMANVFIQAQNVNLLAGETKMYSDIIMGSAYTAAFIIAAALMFSLKNPGAIIEKVSGQADSMSQISWQEAAGAYFAAQRGIGMAKGALAMPGKLASGAANVVGKAQESDGFGSFITDTFGGRQMNEIRGAYFGGRHAALERQDREDELFQEAGLREHRKSSTTKTFKASNDGGAVRARTGTIYLADGTAIGITADDAVEALASEINKNNKGGGVSKKDGYAALSNFRKALNKAGIENSFQFDDAKHKMHGSVEYTLSVDKVNMLRAAGVNLNELTKRAPKSIQLQSDGSLRVIAHPAQQKPAGGGKGKGPASGGGGGNNTTP